MYGSPRRSAQNLFLASGAPVTMTLIAANVATFLVGFFTFNQAWPGPGGPFWWLVFTGQIWPTFFWTALTWPLVAPIELIGLLFGCLWAYWMGTSLERSWGTRPFLLFLAATSALTALTLWLGGRLLGAPVIAQGIWLAIAAPTVAWCVLNAREVIRLYMVIPVPAPLLAWLTVAFTWFQVSISGGHPLLGLFALSGCAAAFWYARQGRYAFGGNARASSRPSGGFRSGGRGGESPLRFRDFDREPAGRRGWNLKRWLDDRKQRRELEKLLRRSGFSDPDENKPR